MELEVVDVIYSGIKQITNAAVEFLPTLIFVLIALAVAFVVIKIIQSMIKRVLDKTEFNEDIEYLFYRVSGWVMWFFVLTWLIGSLGLDAVFASLLGVGALAGLAIAMATKDSLSDVVSGIILLQDKHFDLKDRIETLGKTGLIEEVSLRKTRLRMDDGTVQIIPNRKIDASGWHLLKRPKGKKF